MRTCVANWKWE